MLLWRLLTLVLLFFAALPAQSATVLVLRFHNVSQFTDLNWVGESVSEILQSELGEANQIVLDRDVRSEGLKRLALRSDANFTKGTLIHLGQSLDADYLVYGSYDAKLQGENSQLRDSSVTLTAHLIDLRKLHDGPDVSETGRLADLARLEEHLAWQMLKYLDPHSNPQLDKFLSPQKLIRVDAQESYVRGLLSPSKEQRQKWFQQAATLDAKFVSPAFEMGKLMLDSKEYRQAIQWFQRVPAPDVRFAEARFRMALCAYNLSDFNSAAGYLREVAKTYPLNEVYNNLGAAEEQLNLASSVDDFRHALDGDPNDAVYLFNLGAALLRKNLFDEAGRRLQAAAERDSSDDEAEILLAKAQDKEVTPAGSKPLAPPRLKQNFDASAFRQLKAMLSAKGSE